MLFSESLTLSSQRRAAFGPMQLSLERDIHTLHLTGLVFINHPQLASELGFFCKLKASLLLFMFTTGV